MLDTYTKYKNSIGEQNSIRIYRLILKWGRSRPRESVERSMSTERHRSSTASCSQEPPPLQPILIPQSPNSRRNLQNQNQAMQNNRMSVEVTRAAEAGVTRTSPLRNLPIPPNIPKPPRRASSTRHPPLYHGQPATLLPTTSLPQNSLQHSNKDISFKDSLFQNENSENANPNIHNPNIAFTPHFPSSPASFQCDASSISFVEECAVESNPPPPPLQDRFVQQAERPHRPVLSMAIAREQACDEIDLCAVQEHPRMYKKLEKHNWFDGVVGLGIGGKGYTARRGRGTTRMS